MTEASDALKHQHQLELENDIVKMDLTKATKKKENLAARVAELEKENDFFKHKEETDRAYVEELRKDNEIITKEVIDTKKHVHELLERKNEVSIEDLQSNTIKEDNLAAQVDELEKENEALRKKKPNQSAPTEEELWNGVTMNDHSPEAMLRRHPKVDVETCLNYSSDNTGRFMDTNSWFEIERSINNIQRSKKLLSLSLFQRKSHFPFGAVPKDELKQWTEKYLSRLIPALGPGGVIANTFSDFDVHLYLANDLTYFLDENILPQPENLTVHIMKSSSIGASPGTLWRFLAMSNQDYDLVVVTDTGKPYYIPYILSSKL